ncbi:MAG: SdrD B-like domain-containing protein, partial [Bacteroidia bacterium]
MRNIFKQTFFLAITLLSSLMVQAQAIEICTGEEYTLSVPSGVMGQWYLNGSPIAGATDTFYVVTSPGDYNFVGADTNGCTFSSCSVASFVPGTCARLGNYVWNDLNSDGINNEAASAGINGVHIELYKDNGSGSYTLVDSTVTANKNGNPGYYQFFVHTFGDYLVRFIPPTGKNLTQENQTANTDNNSDANGVGVSGIVNLVANENDSTIDAGFITPCVIGDILYLASNVKGADPDAFDRGMIQYLQSLGNTVTAALTEQTTGFGLKDFFTNTAIPLNNFNGFDAIIVSPTVEWNSTTLLQDSLRATRLPVMVSDFWNMDSIGLVGNTYFVSETQGTVYDGANNIDLYNYDPLNPSPTYNPGIFWGD